MLVLPVIQCTPPVIYKDTYFASCPLFDLYTSLPRPIKKLKLGYICFVNALDLFRYHSGHHRFVDDAGRTRLPPSDHFLIHVCIAVKLLQCIFTSTRPTCWGFPRFIHCTRFSQFSLLVDIDDLAKAGNRPPYPLVEDIFHQTLTVISPFSTLPRHT